MKLNRYIASTPPGIVVTAGLLLLMQQLINNGEEALVESADQSPIFKLHTLRLPPPVATQPDPVPPRRIIKPLQPPGTSTVSVPVSNELAPTGLPGHESVQLPEGSATELAAWPDSPLVSMVRVEPDYPLRAAADGREGYVIVQFDVGTDGTVSNEKIVKSSDRVFERAALTAASRFRYKARVVDGQPQPTTNVQTLFRFTMNSER